MTYLHGVSNGDGDGDGEVGHVITTWFTGSYYMMYCEE